jgi:tRNA G18 (ribose-2'-O)-methylase SpoU
MFARIDRQWGDDVPVYVASPDQLKSLTGYRMHRGALAAMRRWQLPSVESLCRDARRIAVMENIVDHTNVGALIRSAAALGVDAVLATPSCGDPLYRRAARVSMGTVFQVPWTRICEQTVNTENDGNYTSNNPMPDRPSTKDHHDPIPSDQGERRIRHTKEQDRRYWPDAGMAELKRLGFTTVAMALCDDSISLDELVRRLNNEPEAVDHIDKLALIFGTEGDGLAPRTIADTDLTVKIPMSRGVDSLNVAASSALTFYATRVREQ